MSEPIIIGGCGSSGTTLIRKMLNAHPNIACGPEMSVFDRPKMYKVNLTWLYTMYRNLDFDSLDEEMLFALRMQPTNFTYCGLHPDNHSKYYHEPEEIERMFDLVETMPEFFDLYFSRYAKKQGKKRWAEKTPNNLFCIDDIFSWYPEAHFIVMIRDGRDVVLSLTARRSTHSIVAIFRWLVSAAAYIEIIKREPDYIDRILRVDYEDLVLDPERTLRKVCLRIGEKYDPAMLDYWKARLPEDEQKDKPQDEIKDPKEATPADYGTQPVFSDSVGKWKDNENLNPTLEKMMRLTMTETLKKLGCEHWPE
jgi:hypothetical protein